MAISNTTSEVILNIENDPSTNNANHNLINLRILTRKVYLLILIQILVKYALIFIFSQCDSFREFSLKGGSKFLIIILAFFSIICLIIMCFSRSINSKTFNSTIFSIFAISNGLVSAISFASNGLYYRYYVSDLLTSLILIGLFLLAYQNKHKVSLAFEVMIIVVFYLFSIFIIFITGLFKVNHIDKFVFDCLILIIIVVGTNLIQKKYKLKSNDYIFVYALLNVYILIIALSLLVLILLVVYIFRFKIY